MINIYKTSLDDGETIEKSRNFLDEFPEAQEFVSKYLQFCIFVKNSKKGIWTIKLFSDRYEYAIVFVRDKNYCCASYTCRKFGIMENWTRGNDMIDGHDIRHSLNVFEKQMLKNELIFIGDVNLIEDSSIIENYSDERAFGNEQ